jgi:hypothetical protein
MFKRFVVTAAIAITALGMAQSGSDVTYTYKDGRFEAPGQLDEGFYNFTAVVDKGWMDGGIFRLNEGVTPAEAVEAMQQLDEASMSEDADPLAAMNALMDKVDFVGGPSASSEEAPKGNDPAVGIVLEPGSYVFIGNYGNENDEMSLVSKPLEVVSGDPAEAPQTDLTVNMVDFAFTIPSEVNAGEQTWQVANRGEQLHHISVAKFKPGKTMDDVMAFMETQEGDMPIDEVYHLAALGPGESNYIYLNLEPGAYVALCFMPDHKGEATGQPHIALGMVQAFAVAGK